MGYKIIDDFLDDLDMAEIRKRFFHSEDLPWNFRNRTTWTGDDEDKDNFQFIHMLCSNTVYQNSGDRFIKPILDRLNPSQISRIKLNLQTKRDRIILNPFHNDRNPTFEKKYTIGIFYLNSNDGYTEFEDGTKIKSIENRMLLFSGDTLHRGTTSTDDRRVLMNFNFVNTETEELYK